MDRQEILAQIQTSLDSENKGRFCFVCGAAGVVTEDTPAGEVFVCQIAGHRSPRAFIFDGKAVFAFEDGELVHEATGAIIQRQSGREHQTLLFLRRKFPYQYTIPAGHVEIGQDPEAEMRREVYEETGLTVRTTLRLWPDETPLLNDPCRRGADFHRWYIFEVTTDGQPILSNEGRIIGWYSDDEIQELAAQNLLTAPVHAIFNRLGLFEAK